LLNQWNRLLPLLMRLPMNGGTTSVSLAVPESQITVNPFPISEEWPRAFGMAVTPTTVAALWGARDAGGTIYLYAEQFPHAEPSQNARAIRALGDWIPGVINFSCLKGSQAEKDKIRQIYRELGLNMQGSIKGEEAGIYLLLQLLASNKLKVFASLSGFLTEYRIEDEQSPLLLCCQALILLGRDRMRVKPVKAPEFLERRYSGDRSWMA
jgi:hypothetical protein